jgi:hypothetical protein
VSDAKKTLTAEQLKMYEICLEIRIGGTSITRARWEYTCPLCNQIISAGEIHASTYRGDVDKFYHCHLLCITNNPQTKKAIKIKELQGYERYEKDVRKMLRKPRKKECS